MRRLFPSALLLGIASALAVSAADDASSWIALFDGTSLEHWQKADGHDASEGWEIEDKLLHRKSAGGDLLSKEVFDDFELEFEWKIGPGANSGVKYRFGDYGGRRIGPEYQLLDDAAHPEASPKHLTAALYHVLPPRGEKTLESGGTFNHSRIVAQGARIRHWLNGHLMLDADLDSASWAAALEESKFHGAKDFARRPGHILIQDHGGAVWFKSMRVRRLNP